MNALSFDFFIPFIRSCHFRLVTFVVVLVPVSYHFFALLLSYDLPLKTYDFLSFSPLSLLATSSPFLLSHYPLLATHYFLCGE